MNFLTLEYFITIAEEHSFTRASERLFVSQQSLSEHIKKLENELGTPLFTRGHTLSLTPAGECFLKGSHSILASRNQMLNEISILKEQQLNHLTIAVATFDTPPFLSNLLSEFAKQYPQYNTSIVKRLVSNISSHMKGVNLYFSYLPLDNRLEHYCIVEDELCVAVHENLLSRVYGDRREETERRFLETRDLSYLAKLPYILLYDKANALSQDLKYIFGSYGFAPLSGFQSENLDLNFSMCLKGIGAILLPKYHFLSKLEYYPKSTADAIRLYPVDPRGLDVQLAISCEKGHKLTLAERRFIDLSSAFLRQEYDRVTNVFTEYKSVSQKERQLHNSSADPSVCRLP